MTGNKVVAVGLLSQKDLDLLGSTIARVWPVEDAPCFEELLRAIDEAEKPLKNDGNSAGDKREGH